MTKQCCAYVPDFQCIDQCIDTTARYSLINLDTVLSKVLSLPCRVSDRCHLNF